MNEEEAQLLPRHQDESVGAARSKGDGALFPRLRSIGIALVAAVVLVLIAAEGLSFVTPSSNGGDSSRTRADAVTGGSKESHQQKQEAPSPSGSRTEAIRTAYASWGMQLTEEGLADAVLSMPGLASELNDDIIQFSGYVNITASKRSFYLLTLSQRSPPDDPLVFWTNGGPGCSGLIGYMTEHGPFRPQEDLTLKMNDYSWTKVANMLYVESPTGVGYSFSEGEVSTDYLAGDESVAHDNFKLIQEVLRKHPSFFANDFYLSAESYGGHYIPTLAKFMVSAGETSGINLKGYLVGNPYTDPVENMRGMMGAFWGHQLVPAPVYSEWIDKCGDSDEISTYYDDEYCVELEVAMMDTIGDLDWYGLDFPVCNKDLQISADEVLSAQAVQFLGYTHPRLHKKLKEKMEIKKLATLSDSKSTTSEGSSSSSLSALTNSDNRMSGYDACISDYMTRYFNKEEVKRALHAESSITWSECSSSILYDADDQKDYMEPIYKDLLDNTDLRIMVYSGDDDSICAPLGTQSWIWKLGYEQTSSWAAWYYRDEQYGDGQVGGYHVQFKTPSPSSGDSSRLTFATVHHAGHEVPMYQPMRGFHVFANFIEGVW